MKLGFQFGFGYEFLIEPGAPGRGVAKPFPIHFRTINFDCPSMSSLQSLPYKIHTQILSQLPLRDLLSTCVVSQALNAVADFVLYSTPRVEWQQPSQKALIRTLLTPGCEVLATYVLELNIEPSRYLTPVEYSSGEEEYRENSAMDDFSNDYTDLSDEEIREEEDRSLEDELKDDLDGLRAESDIALLAAAVSDFGLDEESPYMPFMLMLHLLPCLQRLNIGDLDRDDRCTEAPNEVLRGR